LDVRISFVLLLARGLAAFFRALLSVLFLLVILRFFETFSFDDDPAFSPLFLLLLELDGAYCNNIISEQTKKFLSALVPKTLHLRDKKNGSTHQSLP
jgi:hypothetical protein